MADVVDKTTRSRMMSGIQGKNTRPEMFLRKGLHAMGYRFRLHVKDIPGSPDLVFPKYRALVVVHGCFWHGHGCRYSKMPSTNSDFWRDKIESNKLRDARVLNLQILSGWRCLIVWECSVRKCLKQSPSGSLLRMVSLWLKSHSKQASIDEDALIEFSLDNERFVDEKDN